MKSRVVWFNLFLWFALLALIAGCKAPGKSKYLASIRFHLEVNADGTDRSNPVPIGRSTPFMVNVEKIPFLSEHQLLEALLVDTNGAFSLKLQFDGKGTRLLEQYSSSSRGKRTAIFVEWNEQMRWLAAPRLEKRIADGVVVFTPDASREEVEELVVGLNKSAKAIQSGRF